MNAIKTMWAVLWSPLAAILWMLLYAVIFIGWGTEKSDAFVKVWCKYVDEGSDVNPKDYVFPDGESG